MSQPVALISVWSISSVFTDGLFINGGSATSCFKIMTASFKKKLVAEIQKHQSIQNNQCCVIELTKDEVAYFTRD